MGDYTIALKKLTALTGPIVLLLHECLSVLFVGLIPCTCMCISVISVHTRNQQACERIHV